MSCTSTTPVIKNKLVSDEVKKSPLTPCRRVGLGRPSSGLKKLSVQSTINSTPINSKPEMPENNKTEDEQELKCTSRNDVRHEVPLTKSVDSNKKLLSRRNFSQSRTKGLIAKRALCDIDDNCFDNHSISFLSSNDHASTPKIKMSHKNDGKKLKISCDKTSDEVCSGSSPIVDHPRLHFDIEDSENNISIPNSNNLDVTTAMIDKLVSSIKEKKNRLELLSVQQTYSKKHDLEDLRAQTRKWRLAGQEALRYSVSIAKEAGFQVSIKQLIDDHGFSVDLIQYNEEEDDFL